MAISSKQKLVCLYSLAEILSGSTDPSQAMADALAALGKYLGAERGAINLIDRRTGKVQLQAAHGLTDEEISRGSYAMGEGITGRVAAKGRPMAIADITTEPRFLDRTGSRSRTSGPISFICTPIEKDEEVIGVLWIDLPGQSRYELPEMVKFMGLAAKIIAQQVVQWEADRLDEENRRLRSQLATRFSAHNLIGQSPAMHEVFSLIEKVTRSRTTILIRGESGTGKGLVAGALHYSSPRAEEALIKVNCAAIPDNLLEAELFGYEKGAFTGAVRAKPGKFELAQGGTIFLDEIGQLSPGAQAKLLRALQEREMERLGGARTINLDVRVIAATNRNLEAAMTEGEFREDLYYRLNVFPIHLPPLRERKTDILLLVDHFVEKFSNEHDIDVRRVAPKAIDLLLGYHWPGNVRELENCIERAVLLCEDRTIQPRNLPPSLQAVSSVREPTAMPLAVAELEQDLIRSALSQTRGNLTRAAKMLGVTQRMIGYKVKKYEIDPAAFVKMES